MKIEVIKSRHERSNLSDLYLRDTDQNHKNALDNLTHYYHACVTG